MSTRIDLPTQTQGVLPRLYGGTANQAGMGNEMVIVPFLNDSGGTLALGTVVTRSASDPKLHAADTTGEKVIGVVVGRYHPSIDLFQAIAPTADQTAAVCIMGRCDVLTESAAARGDFLRASTTAGEAGVSPSIQSGTFGYVLYQITTSLSQALIGQMETGGGGLSDMWFNVRSYGATGDGTTDDQTAINAAIAALVAAGSGVLYFPAGVYRVTGALTALSVPCLVLGDGSSYWDGATDPVSKILYTSHNSVCFSVTTDTCRFEKLAIVNNHASPVSGAGIQVSGGAIAQRCDFEGLVVSGFYINVDVQVGAQWTMHGCMLFAPVLYALKIRNTVNADAGDWAISDSNFYSQVRHATSAIRIESSGGGKIVNCKINKGNDSHYFTTGIDLSIGTGFDTSLLLVANTSIENVTGDAIDLTTTGSGRYASVAINGCQVALYLNNTGRAVKVSAASTGSWVAGSLADIVIDSCIFYTDGTARAAVELINADNIVLGDFSLDGFNARYTSSGATNITDGASASVTYATPAIVLGTAAAAGAASSVIRSDSTIVAFDATVPAAIGTAATGSQAVASRRDHVHATGAGTPTTIAFGDAAAIGSGPAAAMTDHRHGAPAEPSGSGGHLLISDDSSSPLVFDDILQNDDGTDFLYSDT